MTDATYLGDPPVESPKWNRLRSKGIGGSEIAAVVGLSPWTSAFTLWHRKAGKLGPQQPSESMNWGKRLEPVVCDAFAERHPDVHIRTAGLFHHQTRRWQLASCDRLIATEEACQAHAVLEVKTADAHDAFEWGDDGTDEIPPYYRCQALWYLDTLGLPLSHIAVLIGGNDYREFVIEYAKGEAEWLREEGRKFWQTVLDDQPPPLDGSDSTYQAVREMHPDIEPIEEAIDPMTFEMWTQNAAQAKACTERANLARNLVAEQMGTARYGTVLGERVVIRQSTKGGTPYPKLIPAKKDRAA
jgi:putative phage-type endonuclease